MLENKVAEAIEHFRKHGNTIVVMRTTMGLTEIERFWKGIFSTNGLNMDIEASIWSGISPTGMIIFSSIEGRFLVSWIMDDVDDIVTIDIAREEDIQDAYDSLQTISEDSFKKFTDK